MKTLIINGSPRRNGDTAALLSEMKKYLEGDIIELSAYRNNISPCIDCRYCWKEGKCTIKDDMQVVYDGDYENVVIASPIYMSGLPGPLISLASRLQVYYAAKRFLHKKIDTTPKKAALILVGGGDGGPDNAIKIASWMFKKLGATYNEENCIFSLKTDEIPASQDEVALQKVKRIAENLNKSLY
jgi:multimeric flavodoxin WrbA